MGERAGEGQVQSTCKSRKLIKLIRAGTLYGVAQAMIS